MANNKRYYHKKRANKPDIADVSAIEQQTAQYSAEQLSMSVLSLGVSEGTNELLAKNKILSASDLVRRTEKDMYKVQGLNKKVLFEIKDALKRNGMALRKEVGKVENKGAQRADAVANDAQNVKAQKQDKNKAQDNQKRSSKFGLADRAQSDKGQNKQSSAQAQKQRLQKEKLTEPLPLGEWRKVMKGGKWGYSNGFKIVIPTMYDEIFAFKEGLASVEIDEKCGYIDEENNVVIPLDYDTAMSFSEGFAMVCKGDKCGYINKNNEVVIPFEYDAATPFEGGEAKIKKDGKWGTLTPDGKITWI